MHEYAINDTSDVTPISLKPQTCMEHPYNTSAHNLMKQLNLKAYSLISECVHFHALPTKFGFHQESVVMIADNIVSAGFDLIQNCLHAKACQI